MARLIYLLLLLFLRFLSSNAQTGNIGFENGDFSGWNLSYGRVRADFRNQTTVYSDERQGSLNGHEIMEQGIDPYVRNFASLKTAFWGNYSAKIGNRSIEGSTFDYGVFDKVSKTFNVTQEYSLFQYAYAIVLEDPGHDILEQPAFSFRLLVD